VERPDDQLTPTPRVSGSGAFAALGSGRESPRGRETTFIAGALSEGANLKGLAEYCATSVQMIEQSYGRYNRRVFVPGDEPIVPVANGDGRRGSRRRNPRQVRTSQRREKTPIIPKPDRVRLAKKETARSVTRSSAGLLRAAPAPRTFWYSAFLKRSLAKVRESRRIRARATSRLAAWKAPPRSIAEMRTSTPHASSSARSTIRAALLSGVISRMATVPSLMFCFTKLGLPGLTKSTPW
jgi:hypothetical protein